jgi:phage shock protein PspC (stress-responsive transcriptional regulator)
MRYQPRYTIEQKLAKDEYHKKITGVCAGVARYYGWSRLGVRIATILAFCAMPLATLMVYFAATLLLPSR